jgi:asparagine synthase (glutamine-hydrolysing)
MYQTQYALFSTGVLQRLLADPSAAPSWGLSDVRETDLHSQISGLSTLRAVTAMESEMFLGDRLLRDMDSVSMAHSIEVRVPLVDTGLSDGISGLDDDDRYLPIGKKRLLRRQSSPTLPDSFFERPKRGFEFPMDVWMRGPLRKLIENVLLEAAHCEALGLKPEAVREVWQRFLSKPGAVYWTRPWSLFALMRWASTNGVQLS